MNPLRQLILEYQHDLKENRVSYSDRELEVIKNNLKDAYQTLKEEDQNLHRDEEFMHAYKSAHGLIQHELKERKLDQNLSIDDILNGEKGTFRDNIMKRTERKMRQGDYSHAPTEYFYLCDVIESPEEPKYSSPVIQQLRGHPSKDRINTFRNFIENTYTADYQNQIVPVTQGYMIPDEKILDSSLPVYEQLLALEDLVEESHEFNDVYRAKTTLLHWVHDEAPSRLLAEDFSGENRRRLQAIRRNLMKKNPSTGTPDLFNLPVIRKGESKRGMDKLYKYSSYAAVILSTFFS